MRGLDIWYNLRPTEAMALRRLVQAAQARAAERCKAIILEELTAAGVQFAAEYPVAPRAREKVPA